MTSFAGLSYNYRQKGWVSITQDSSANSFFSHSKIKICRCSTTATILFPQLNLHTTPSTTLVPCSHTFMIADHSPFERNNNKTDEPELKYCDMLDSKVLKNWRRFKTIVVKS